MHGTLEGINGAFESSMKNIEAITGNTADEIEILRNTLMIKGSLSAVGPQGGVNAFNDVAGDY
jgi:hypothetical protein